MNPFLLAILLTSLLAGSALTIQLLVIPSLIARITDRSAVTRVSNQILQQHHSLAIFLLLWICGFLFYAGKTEAAALSVILFLLNLYQRFWIFTKMRLVKQPIGVQDLIQPDNVLREEFNRLQRAVYLLFKVHLLLLLIDLLLCAF